MTVSELKHRDLEAVERGRSQSPYRSTSNIDDSSSKLQPPLASRGSSAPPSLCSREYGLLLDESPIMGSDESDAGDMVCADETCHKVFIWKLRLLHVAMSTVLIYVGVQQMHRTDAAVWITVFILPGVITFVSTVRVQVLELVWVRALISVYLGSAMCLLLWEATALLVAITQQSVTEYPTYNPMNYREGRDTLSVAVCVGWQKFHLVISKEQLKVTHYRKKTSPGISAHDMLKIMVPMLLIPGALAAFCYVDAVRQVFLPFSV